MGPDTPARQVEGPMTDTVGFFCKSYAGRFQHLAQMLTTFARHNVEHLPLTLSLPRADLPAFHARFGNVLDDVTIVADEDYCGHDLTAYRGWHGQQICKLMSFRVVPQQHYAVLDSDCYFIRDITAGELRPRGGKPFIAGTDIAQFADFRPARPAARAVRAPRSHRRRRHPDLPLGIQLVRRIRRPPRL